jgi:[acyl-carrier-protein] S-malonyltransferase
VSICCYNSPRQFVVSGEQEALRALDKCVKDVKGELVPFSMIAMKVDAPFHCSLMNFIEEEIKNELIKIQFAPLKWDVVSTVTGLPYESYKEINQTLSKQLVTAVKWRQTISYLLNEDVYSFLEIGPQSTLKNLFIEITKDRKCYSFDEKEDKEKILQFLLNYKLLPL